MITVRTTRKPGLVGRLGLSLFFAVFLAFGLFFLVMLGIEVRSIVSVYVFWEEVPATMISSGVEEKRGDKPFVPVVQFRYVWKGVSHTSSRYSTSSPSWDDYSKARDRIASLGAGTSTVCFVDPGNPAGGILRRPDPWIAFFLLIPLVFIAVGVWGIRGAWSREPGRAPPVRPPEQGSGRWGPRIFGGLFAAIGAVALGFWYIPSLTRSIGSFRWEETPCTILSSRVKTHSDSDGATYSVDIFYRYAYEGQDYKSNRYGLFGGSSSGRRAKERIVDRYPAGSQRLCYVNPARPSEAALRPGVGWEALLGLFPLAFLGVGLAVMFRSGKSPALPAEGAPVPASDGSLKPRVAPIARFAILLAIALFWNGLISFFLWDVIEDFLHGTPDWIGTVVLIPFVAVGLGFLAAVGHALLGLTNPRCAIRISPASVRAGDTVEISWTCSGSTRRFRRLRIFVEGREEATYRRGTQNVTDRHIFARFPVADLTEGLEMVQGAERCSMPDRIPPSFSAPNNRVVWLIRVHGDIPRWPDVTEEYELPVRGESP